MALAKSAGQWMSTLGMPARPLFRQIMSAITFLPVPLSPRSKMVHSSIAARQAIACSSAQAGLRVTKPGPSPPAPARSAPARRCRRLARTALAALRSASLVMGLVR